ncbi:uncharacterized protein [Ciconia boyciana]|uniref:uncharacterized protein isoform X1 n=1 Tax=Ciconia boyciana TaxID=52775 RepID=UPI003BA1EB45
MEKEKYCDGPSQWAEQEESKNRGRQKWRKTSQRRRFHREAANPAGSRSQGFGGSQPTELPRPAPPLPAAATTARPQPALPSTLLPFAPAPALQAGPALPAPRRGHPAPPRQHARAPPRDGQRALRGSPCCPLPSGQAAAGRRHPRPPQRRRPSPADRREATGLRCPPGPALGGGGRAEAAPPGLGRPRPAALPPVSLGLRCPPLFPPLVRHRAATQRGPGRRHGAARSGGVPAAPPHDGDRRREAAAAAASAGGRHAPRGRLARARRRTLRDAPASGLASGRRTAPARPGPGVHPAPSVHLTALKSRLHTLRCARAALSRLRSGKFTTATRFGAGNIKGVLLL